jgi:hypothetical protein
MCKNKKYASRMCCLVTLITIIAKLRNNTNLGNQITMVTDRSIVTFTTVTIVVR